MPLSRLLCWAGDSFHAERVGFDGSIEFLVRSSGWNFSPGALADRLNDADVEFRPGVDRMPIKAVEEIPDSTVRALSGEMSDRSEERRVGKGCVSKCRYSESTYN